MEEEIFRPVLPIVGYDDLDWVIAENVTHYKSVLTRGFRPDLGP